MAWETVEARNLREFAWARVTLSAMAFSLMFTVLRAASGSPARMLPLLWLGLTAFWFVFFTGYYAVQLKREGLVVFPEPPWHRKN